MRKHSKANSTNPNYEPIPDAKRRENNPEYSHNPIYEEMPKKQADWENSHNPITSTQHPISKARTGIAKARIVQANRSNRARSMDSLYNAKHTLLDGFFI